LQKNFQSAIIVIYPKEDTLSFEKMPKPELYRLATENFGCDISETATKPQILAKLAEDGVTWDMAVAFDANARALEEVENNVVTSAQVTIKQEEVIPVTVTTVTETPASVVATTVVPEKVLLVMNRDNATFEIRGYRFTRTHPFGVVDAKDAEYIVQNVEGFRHATVGEAQEFYG
jgi:hypothetical protein